MYLGPFYFDTKELFLVLASVFLGLAMALGWSLWWFDKRALLTLTVLILLTKGLLPAIHNEAFFILAMYCSIHSSQSFLNLSGGRSLRLIL